MTTVSRLDQVYRRILLTKFFVKGWGNPENLKRIFEFRKILSNRDTCRHLVSSDYPIHIDKEDVQKECTVLQGHFKSPLVDHLPGIMPKVVENAKFEMILPNKWNYKHPHLKPVCLHLAGTGDHGFFRRKVLAGRPLLKESGIASIILENPYYGVRKPKQQLRSSLHNVSDLFVMGGALILESLALFHWCERQGYGPLGVTGVSMGGFMASLAATNWHRPIALIPCLSWSTASTVFCEGVMSGAIPWGLLEDQFVSDDVYRDEISQMIYSPEKSSRYYRVREMGHTFVKNFPESFEEMKEIQDDSRTGTNDVRYTDGIPSSSAIQHGRSHEKHATAGITNKSMQYHTLSSTPPDNNSNDSQKSPIRKIVDTLTFKKSSNTKSKKKGRGDPALAKDTLEFMKGMMDECTHLGNFSTPVDPSLIVIVTAESDAYVPREKVLSLEELWPGSEVRSIDTGHIAGFLLKQQAFRSAIIDAFDKQVEKHYKNGYPGRHI